MELQNTSTLDELFSQSPELEQFVAELVPE